MGRFRKYLVIGIVAIIAVSLAAIAFAKYREVLVVGKAALTPKT